MPPLRLHAALVRRFGSDVIAGSDTGALDPFLDEDGSIDGVGRPEGWSLPDALGLRRHLDALPGSVANRSTTECDPHTE